MCQNGQHFIDNVLSNKFMPSGMIRTFYFTKTSSGVPTIFTVNFSWADSPSEILDSKLRRFFPVGKWGIYSVHGI